MRDERDDLDSPTRECPDCGEPMGSEAVWFQGRYRHERCIQDRREVQQSIEADRQADVEVEDDGYGHGV